MVLTELSEWRRVAAHIDAHVEAQATGAGRDYFVQEPDRMARLSAEAAGVWVDAAKQQLPGEALMALHDVLGARGFSERRRALFDGDEVNPTERRPALHTAARGGARSAAANDAAKALRERARAFANAVRSGTRTGARGRPLRTLISIGIGGSDLGPRLVWEALKHHREPGMDVRFVANIDAADINDALSGVDPDTTLILVVSKSFTTQETRTNAETARAWLMEHMSAEEAARHVAAVTARPDRAEAFGVAKDAIFAFDEGVGGRYSLWSSVSLAVEAGLQEGAFDALLAGAADMDAHFAAAEPAQNLPVLLSCVDVWNRNGLGAGSRVVVPYATRLRLLPFYLQQLEMESNGKGVTLDGRAAGATSPVVWGSEGTNAQHAYFQQLHQGADAPPVEFVGVIQDGEARAEHHRALMANMAAQGEALLKGRSVEVSVSQGLADGLSPDEAQRIGAHRACPGGRGSTTVLLPELSPRTLGALIALYEHKTFVNAVFWDINPFDQWGVELGKVLAKDTLAAMERQVIDDSYDASTRAILGRLIEGGRSR